MGSSCLSVGIYLSIVGFHNFFSDVFSLCLCFIAVTVSPKAVSVFKLPDFPSSMSLSSTQSYYCSLTQLLDEEISSVQSKNPSLLARCFCSFTVLYLAAKRCRFKPPFLTPGSSSCAASSTFCAHAGWTHWWTSRTCTGWTPPSSPPGWSHGW